VCPGLGSLHVEEKALDLLIVLNRKLLILYRQNLHFNDDNDDDDNKKQQQHYQ
jgi:hypothetical protein